jgi:hypothetical protein
VLADARYQLKRFCEAAEDYEKAGTLGWAPALTFYNAACSWALAGDKDRALVNLEKGFATGFVVDRGAARRDPVASLREDPRFQKLTETQ